MPPMVLTFAASDPTGGAGFWRVELWGESSPMAITNHIVVS